MFWSQLCLSKTSHLIHIYTICDWTDCLVDSNLLPTRTYHSSSLLHHTLPETGIRLFFQVQTLRFRELDVMTFIPIGSHPPCQWHWPPPSDVKHSTAVWPGNCWVCSIKIEGKKLHQPWSFIGRMIFPNKNGGVFCLPFICTFWILLIVFFEN